MSEEPFECKVCHKSFHHLLNLLGHSRLHSDSFRKGSVQLRNPKRLVLNTAQISIYCSFCDKRFSGKTELLNHLKTHHPDEEIFQCDICNKSFSEKLISSHMEAHKNEKSFPCDKNQNAKTKKNRQITAPQEGGATYRHLKTGPKQKNEVMSATRQCVRRLLADVVELERSQSLAHKSTQKKGSIEAPCQIYSKGKKELLNPKEVSKCASSVTETDLEPHVDRANQNSINKTDNCEMVSSQPSTSQDTDASDASAKLNLPPTNSKSLSPTKSADRANQNSINKTDNCEMVSSQPSTSQDTDASDASAKLNLPPTNSKSLSPTKSADLLIKKSDDVKQNQVARAAQSKKRKLKPLISQFTIEIATSAVDKSDIFPGYPKPGNHKFIRLCINEDKVKTVSQRVHKQAKPAEKRPKNS